MSDPHQSPNVESTLPADLEPTPRPSLLTSEQKRKIAVWFNTKIQPHKPKCPMCGTDDWSLADDLVAPGNHSAKGGLIIGGVAYPHFMLVCSNCGNTQFINAVMSGIVEGKPK